MLDGVDCFLDLILERGLHAASRAGWLVHLACFQLVAVAVLSVAEESTHPLMTSLVVNGYVM